MIPTFLNLTQLEDKVAQDIVSRLEDLIERGEEQRAQRLTRAEESMDIYRNKIWTDEDLQFFEQVGMQPYQFPDHRVILSNLISKQRKQRFNVQLVATDIESFKRYRKGREEYAQKNIEAHGSLEEAYRYYDNVADDKYAKAVTAMLTNVRNENKAKYKESEVFQRGIVTGLDFFKACYSRKNRRTGGIEIASVPQRAVVYDENAIEYDLSDAEFIGQLHEFYYEDLIKKYPQAANAILEKYKQYTNKDRIIANKKEDRGYADRFKYLNRSIGDKLIVAELYIREHEPRIIVFDRDTSEERMADFGLDFEQVLDKLKEFTLASIVENSTASGDIDTLRSPQLKQTVEQLVNDRYELYETTDEIWYKAVFTEDALFEYGRSEYPHGSHPYYPFFAQHVDGFFSGLIEDIKDVIIALNKALAFRDLMMAHGAKGLLLLDADAMAKSGYSLDDVAEVWTQVGGMMLIKPRAGQSLKDVALPITSIGEGLNEITAIIQDLDNRIYRISGVNMAQMGVTQGETPTSRYKLQLNEADNNNGLIFDNFVRSVEGFYNDKVVPLVVEFMQMKQTEVIRQIGDQHEPWINIDLEEDFGLFDDAIRTGEYGTILTFVDDNPQLNSTRAAQRMQLALAGAVPVEWAMKFSDDPDRYEMVKSLQEYMFEAQRKQVINQVSLQMVQQIALQNPNMTVDGVNEMIKQLQLEALKQQTQQTKQQGGENLGRQASEPIRQQNLESTL